MTDLKINTKIILAIAISVLLSILISVNTMANSSVRNVSTKKAILKIKSVIKTIVNPKDGAEMILIPAGEFIMGTTREQVTVWLSSNYMNRIDDKRIFFTHELPQRKVYLDAYYIYKTEVTVAQYRKFCKLTKNKMPDEPPWKWQDNHPIVGVNWDDAMLYAKWAGTALPTEAQWEKAARGTKGLIYPWGNDWDDKKCSNSVNDTNYHLKTSAVGSFPAGASPYGVMDMAGNAWEWCADWYGCNYYKTAPTKNPTGPKTGKYRVLRGGSWNCGSMRNMRTADRSGDPPTTGNDSNGFRCVAY